MARNLTQLFALFALAVCSAHAVADTININIVGGRTGTNSANATVAGDAGVVLSGDWFNIADNGGVSTTAGSQSGGPLALGGTGASITWHASNTFTVLAGAPVNQHVALMNGYLDDNATDPSSTTLTVADIPFLQYVVYAYVGSDTDGRTGTISNGSTTYSYATNAVSFGGNSSYIRTMDTASGNPSANYAVFAPSSANSVTITNSRGSNNTGLLGVQVVEVNDYQAQVFNENPYLYYTLNETTGTHVDDLSGNNRDGVYTGGITLGKTAASADLGKAASFDGVDGHIDTGVNLADVIGRANTSSVEAWIKTTAVGNELSWKAPAITGVEASGSPANDIFWGWLDDAGHINFQVSDGPNIGSTNAINDDEWHYIVMTRDAGTEFNSLYVDGVLQGTSTGGGTGATLAFSDIGHLANTSVYLDAELSDVAIYTHALSAADVALHYSNASTLVPTPGALPAGLSLMAVVGTFRRRH